MPQSPTDRVAKLREYARAGWEAGLRAVDPEACVSRALMDRPDLWLDRSDMLIVAAGKAAPGMLRGALRQLHGDTADAVPAIVLMPDHADPGRLPPSTLLLRGGHPSPTPAGMEATRRLVDEVDSLGAGKRLLFLLSGGASALLEAPIPGINPEDLAALHGALLASGLPIHSVNLVRGCLSAVKAGRLAERAHPARVTTLAISDVEGDDPAVIGSGPTFPGQLSRGEACREALALVRASGLRLPDAARKALESGALAGSSARADRSDAAEAPDYTVVASIADAVDGAAAELKRRGWSVASGAGGPCAYLRGDTASAARRILAAIEAPRLQALVFGGETTVAVTASNPGHGGRNLDLAARIAIAIEGRADVAIAVAGTDGVDGSSRAAGAIVDGGSCGRVRAAGRDLAAALATFDTETALEASGDLLVTGPTGTNVGDLVVGVVLGS